MRSAYLLAVVLLCGLWLVTGPGCPTTYGDDDDDDNDDSGADDDDVGDDDTGDDDTGDDDTGDDDTGPADADGDGHDADVDCDDNDASVYPGAPEVECNGVDEDCDGAAEISVPGDHSSIQDAIDAASDGDMVCVDSGNFFGNLDFSGKAIHVQGQGPSSSVIDGTFSGPAVQFVNNEGSDSILEGFKLMHGESMAGGGLYVLSSAPTLIDLLIEDNVADQGGGAYLDYASPTLTDVTIHDNDATDNGGGGLFLYFSHPTLQHVTITGNHGTYAGGGAYLHESDPVLDDVVIDDNDVDPNDDGSGGHGGGLYLYYSEPVLANVAIVDNLAAVYGGGVYVHTASPTFENVTIAGNVTSGGGGALYMNYADPTLTNVTLAGNEAATAGGGLFLADSDPTLYNVIIAGNSAPGWGGGAIYLYSGSPSLFYCDIWDNSPSDYYGIADPVGTFGNIGVDPQFLDTSAPSALDWDLHLAAASGLVDAGVPSSNDPDGSGSDIGAYGGADAGSWDLDGDGYDEWWQPGPYDHGTYPALGWDCDDRDASVHPGNGC